MHTDPIADFLTRLRNASRAGHAVVTMPTSKIKKAIADILKEHGFLQNVRTEKDGKFERLVVEFVSGRPALMLKRMSTPGQRKYLSSSSIRPVRNGLGLGIVSTSRGMMTTVEAKEKGVGGEYICEVF